MKTGNQRIRCVSSSNRGRRAFTLIELLVVIAVILILVGISLKMMAVVTNKAGTAKTLYVLEQTRNALDAYHVAVGSVPNVTIIKYDYFNGGGKDKWTFDMSKDVWSNEVYGLSYFIGYDTSNPRYSSWQKFARAVMVSGSIHTNPPISRAWSDKFITTNNVVTILDAWEREIKYQPNPNCDGYTIWSVGPDGVSGTKDDIGITKNE